MTKIFKTSAILMSAILLSACEVGQSTSDYKQGATYMGVFGADQRAIDFLHNQYKTMPAHKALWTSTKGMGWSFQHATPAAAHAAAKASCEKNGEKCVPVMQNDQFVGK